VDALEAELRRQEDQIYAVQAQLARSESELALAKKEAETLRVELADRGRPALLPEQSQALNRLSGVRVQKYFSGGLNRDGEPGDDLLNVVVVPHDADGESLKWAGEVEIEAIDLTAPEEERHLGVWRFSPDEVAKHWQSGLTSGFQFRMPWQSPPASENIVLHARFRTSDGRQFGTSAEIHITPDPEVVARAKERRLANRSEDSTKPAIAMPPDPAAPLPAPDDPIQDAKPDPVRPIQSAGFEEELLWTPIDDNGARD
jgi:hypothetical protein